MTPTALALVLLAALLHAGWNLAVKAAPDQLVATWAQVTLGAGLLMPFALLTGAVPFEVWPSIALSGGVHLLYSLSLASAYRHGDISAVYPVARGMAPPLVALLGVLLLGDRLGPLDVAAVALVSLGIVGVGLRGGSRRGLGWAVTVGLTITGYTLIDAAAVRRAGSPFGYTVAVLTLTAVGLTLVTVSRRGSKGLSEGLRTAPLRNLAAGVASVAAYALVLAAARVAPVGLVSAGREVSVVFGALGGWLLLGEAMGPRRLAWSAVIAVGILALAF